jgi:hypothetical protein
MRTKRPSSDAQLIEEVCQREMRGSLQASQREQSKPWLKADISRLSESKLALQTETAVAWAYKP